MEFLRHLAASLTRTLSIISAALLVLAVLVNIANVVGRYALKSPIIWAEEAMSYCMIASVFAALPVLGWRRQNMRMDILVSLLPSRVRTSGDLILDGAVALFGMVFALFSIPVLQQVLGSGQRSEALELPMWVPHSWVPLGIGLMGVLLALRIALDLKGRKLGGPP